jgi:hypothetical protein
MSHGGRTKGTVFVDLKAGNTGFLQKSNHAKYRADAPSSVNTFANEQGFAVVLKELSSGSEVLWDYGANYWDDPSSDGEDMSEARYARQEPEHDRVRRYPSRRHSILMQTMTAMIQSVGFVLYKLDEKEFEKCCDSIDKRYENPKFAPQHKKESPGWRAIFNTDFAFAADGPKRWQGPIQWRSDLMPSFVSDVDELSEVEGEFTQPNVMETDNLTAAQLFHFDHDPLEEFYDPIEIGFAIIAVADDVFLDVVPGSHSFTKYRAANSSFTVRETCQGKRIRIPRGHAILAHPLLIHAGTNGIGPRDRTVRIHLYRLVPAFNTTRVGHLTVFCAQASAITSAN